jgi:methionyl-tRNA synthetase
LDTTLYRAADAIHVIASLLEPVMPATAERIIRMLGTRHERSWQGLAVHTLPVGGSLGSADPLFPRVEDTTIARQTAAASATAASGNPMSNTSPLPPDQPNPGAAPDAPAAAATVDAGERISIDDFMRVDLRVARILTAERVPKSKKLVKLTIDVGSEQRTLVAGIAEAYEPDALVGRTIVVVANLKPATIMGIQSNGMVLAGSPDGGKPTLLGFEDPPPPGTRVR